MLQELKYVGGKEVPVHVGALWALPLVGGEEQVPLAAERLSEDRQ